MAERGNLYLPEDFTLDIPYDGLYWLLKSGVSSNLAREYKIGWSDAMNRVVIPVWGLLDELIAVQSRAVHPDQKPKYLNKTGEDYRTVLYWSDDNLFLDNPITDVVVLTEDILSTIRVGRICPAVSSLGTSLSDKAASIILRGFNKVIIWYDGDEAGVNGSRKARRTLEMQGAEVYEVKTDEDPKAYSNEDIRRILMEVL